VKRLRRSKKQRTELWTLCNSATTPLVTIMSTSAGLQLHCLCEALTKTSAFLLARRAFIQSTRCPFVDGGVTNLSSLRPGHCFDFPAFCRRPMSQAFRFTRSWSLYNLLAVIIHVVWHCLFDRRADMLCTSGILNTMSTLYTNETESTSAWTHAYDVTLLEHSCVWLCPVICWVVHGRNLRS